MAPDNGTRDHILEQIGTLAAETRILIKQLEDVREALDTIQKSVAQLQAKVAVHASIFGIIGSGISITVGFLLKSHFGW